MSRGTVVTVPLMALARVEYFESVDGKTVIGLIGGNGETFFSTETLELKGEANVERRARAWKAALDEALENGRIVRREE